MEKTDSLLLISHVKKSFGTLEVLKVSASMFIKAMWFQFSDVRLRKNHLASLRQFPGRADYGSISLDDKTIDLKTATKEQASEIQRKRALFFRTTIFLEIKRRLRTLRLV